MVRHELLSLSLSQQEEFLEEYYRKIKSTGNAYCLWFCLGWHYAYLRKWGLQVLYWLSFGGFLMWAFIDLFRIPRLVDDYNKDVAISVLRDQKMISS
jgi:hypothetical protein